MRALRLVLASASPRRLELLALAGYTPVVSPPDVDEAVRDGEAPTVYVARLARAKALAVARGPDDVVLAADTTVVLDDAVIGKPADAHAAAGILRLLSGRTHTVSTGVAVIDDAGAVHELLTTTEVTFGVLDDATVARYVATGEPLDKAGAYGIQGRGAALVEGVVGSWTNVVGLPLAETVRLLRSLGVEPA